MGRLRYQADEPRPRFRAPAPACDRSGRGLELELAPAAPCRIGLSIIIPTKNRPLLLRRALSGLAQASGSFEVIVVDDGSWPLAADLNQTACQRVSRCRYLRLPGSRGASAARNHGLRLSLGDHVWFMDDDDYALAPTVADVLHAISTDRGAAILLMPCERVLDEVPIEHRVPLDEADKLERYRRFGTEVTTSCAVFPRALLERLGGWDESLLALQDTDLFLRAAEVAKFACLPTEPVRVDTSAADRITYAFVRSQIGKLQFLRKHWRHLPLNRRLRYLGQILMCTPWLRAARARRQRATLRCQSQGARGMRRLESTPPA